MTEQRHDWNEYAAQQSKERRKKRLSLIARKNQIAKEIKSVGNDFAKYDKLKAEQREVIAQLATL